MRLALFSIQQTALLTFINPNPNPNHSVICCVTFVYITIGLLSGQITFWCMGFKEKDNNIGFGIRTRYRVKDIFVNGLF